MLGVSRQGYYRYRKRPTSATELRRCWLIGLIREIHVASRGTYGYRRIHAELTNGHLRQYFLKGADLAGCSPEDLTNVAHQLNDRPR